MAWCARLFAEVRDSQVQQGRFSEAVDELSDVVVLGPVRARIRADLQSVELPARERARTEMDSPRYLALLAALTRWRSAPPLTTGISSKALRTRAARAARTADHRLDEALASDTAGRSELLHRARKAAKRARYAAELTGMKRKAAHYKKIHSVLGHHQDTVVARDALRRMGAAAGTTDGENGFTFGILYAREVMSARECVAAVRRLR